MILVPLLEHLFLSVRGTRFMPEDVTVPRA